MSTIVRTARHRLRTKAERGPPITSAPRPLPGSTPACTNDRTGPARASNENARFAVPSAIQSRSTTRIAVLAVRRLPASPHEMPARGTMIASSSGLERTDLHPQRIEDPDLFRRGGRLAQERARRDARGSSRNASRTKAPRTATEEKVSYEPELLSDLLQA